MISKSIVVFRKSIRDWGSENNVKSQVDLARAGLVILKAVTLLHTGQPGGLGYIFQFGIAIIFLGSIIVVEKERIQKLLSWKSRNALNSETEDWLRVALSLGLLIPLDLITSK